MNVHYQVQFCSIWRDKNGLKSKYTVLCLLNISCLTSAADYQNYKEGENRQPILQLKVTDQVLVIKHNLKCHLQ